MKCDVIRHFSPQRLGNQLGFLSLGLEYHLKFGVKLIITKWQAWELSRAFAIDETCFKTSHFCVVLPKKCPLPKVEIVKTVTKAWLLKNKAESMKFGNVSKTRINLPEFPIFMKNLVTGTLH